MNSQILISLLLVSITTTKCDIWSEELPELAKVSIQSDKSIRFEENLTELQLSGLGETLHYESLSKLNTVSRLKIFNNKIRRIESGALCSPPNLQSLHLNFAGNTEAPKLTKDVFKLCHLQLEELFLRFDFDNPSKIHHDALEDLHLKSLGLQHVRLKHLRKNFLKLKQNELIRLILSRCDIRSIESDVFDEMINLEEVEISYNRKLTELPEYLFAKTTKLRRLWLQYNGIKELNWGEFDGLHFLEDLNLSGNRLTYFDAREISESLPHLKRLEIKKNLWACEPKKALAEDLEKMLNRSVEVVFVTEACKG